MFAICVVIVITFFFVIKQLQLRMPDVLGMGKNATIYNAVDKFYEFSVSTFVFPFLCVLAIVIMPKMDIIYFGIVCHYVIRCY